ncbi:lipopolysaccharide biosynthesis protein [Microbispora sp. H13382]|uniref:lipopolysaccharide biosynthesis protein n=1 Tax=Microbispora sp. H13382 TaxID=2729112 RepID=UPI0021757866|nr:polysaccharide biosynthesis C-terminal domain-containing protein [Microbispora sp. H13382]
MTGGGAGNGSLRKLPQTMMSQAAPLVLAAVAGVLLSRCLQPEGRGIYATVTTTAGTALVVGHLSVGRSQMALWPALERHRPLAGNAAILGLLLGAAAAAAAFVLVTVLHVVAAPHLLAVALLAVPFGVAAVNLRGIALLQSRVGLANRATVLPAVALYVPILLLAVTGTATVTAVVALWAVSTILPFVLFFRPLGLPAAGEVVLARRQVALSGRYHLGTVAVQLLLTVDVLLLNALTTPAEVGLYTVATSFLSLSRVPTDALAQIVLSRQAVPDETAAREITARVVRLTLLLVSAVVCVLACAAPLVVPLLYGHAFAGSVAPLLALAPGMVPWSLQRPVEQYLVRLGRPMTMNAVAAGALALNLALNAVLIPLWGALGAALASTASYSAMAVVETAWFARAAGLGVADLLPRTRDVRWAYSALRPGRRRADRLSAAGV